MALPVFDADLLGHLLGLLGAVSIDSALPSNVTSTSWWRTGNSTRISGAVHE